MEPIGFVSIKVEIKEEPDEASEASAPEEQQPTELVFTEHICIKLEAECDGNERVESETVDPSKKETAEHFQNETALAPRTTETEHELQVKRTRNKPSQLSDEDKIRYRREQKKLSIRRARARMTAEAIEERRKKDREKYHKKKTKGLIRTIRDLEPGKQLEVRKIWREKAAKKREKEHLFRTFGNVDYERFK